MATFEYAELLDRSNRRSHRECWVRTSLGREFHYLEPALEEFEIQDIAEGLSKRVRFAGQGDGFYSVASHSIIGAQWFIEEGALDLAFRFLLHDGNEAFLPDIPSPLKHQLSTSWDKFERTIDLAIGMKFDCRIVDIPRTKQVDSMLAQVEGLTLLRNWEDEFEVPEDFENFVRPRILQRAHSPWYEEKGEFLHLFHYLRRNRLTAQEQYEAEYLGTFPPRTENDQ